MWKVTLENDRLVFTPFFGDPAGQDPNDEITADQLVHTLKSRDAEIRDLKLENDRLQQRDKLMYNFIKSVAVSRYEWVSVQADEILRRLEDLG